MPVLANKIQSSNSASITDIERPGKLALQTPDSPKELKKKKKPPKFLDSIHQMQKNTLLKNESFNLVNK